MACIKLYDVLIERDKSATRLLYYEFVDSGMEIWRMQWNMETVYIKKQWNGNGLCVMENLLFWDEEMDGKNNCSMSIKFISSNYRSSTRNIISSNDDASRSQTVYQAVAVLKNQSRNSRQLFFPKVQERSTTLGHIIRMLR